MFAVNDSLDALYTIDMETGATTLFGPTGMTFDPTPRMSPRSLAVAPDGLLYADNDSPEGVAGLLRVEQFTGTSDAYTAIPENLRVAAVGSLAMDPAGVLYTRVPDTAEVGAGQLARVNQSTSTLSPLGGDLLCHLPHQSHTRLCPNRAL